MPFLVPVVPGAGLGLGIEKTFPESGQRVWVLTANAERPPSRCRNGPELGGVAAAVPAHQQMEPQRQASRP